MIINSENIVLFGSILLFVSVILGKVSSRFGTPLLLLFLFVGMLFGSGGFGVEFDSPHSAQMIGMIALCIILFSGGMDTKFSDIRPVLGQGLVLSTLGVVLTALFTGVFAYFASGWMHYSLTLIECFLLAAVMSSTDSASVFSILRSKNRDLKHNLRPMLELESGSNDPMAYVLTMLLMGIISSDGMTGGDIAVMFLVQMSVGAVAGYLLGRMAVLILNHIKLQNKSLYSVLLLSFVFFIFSFTNLIRGNGYLAVYIAGLVVGNQRIPFKNTLATFFDGFTWLFQIVMFLVLGLLVNPIELLDIAEYGLMIGGFVIILARPLSVFISLLPFRRPSFKGRLYVSWVGLRGAVPIIFATYPMVAGLEHANLIFNTVFFITILSLLVQGTTVSTMADWLGLSFEPKKQHFDLIDLPDKIRDAMAEMELRADLIPPDGLLKSMQLPPKTLVIMIRRGEGYLVPKGNTQLHEGDKLLVIADENETLSKEYKDLGLTYYK